MSKKNEFGSLNAKNDIVDIAAIIAADKGIFIYEVVAEAFKAHFPEYFKA